MLGAVKQKVNSSEYAASEHMADRDFKLGAAQQDGHALKHAAAERKADREIVLES